MASNYINNLSNTYQQSPSLQNQFATEQDYLDLFDNNKTTPAMAQAYVPTNDTTGIKSIVNTAKPIINTGGDGGNGPPDGPTDPGVTSDDYGLGVDDPTGMGYELSDKDKSDISGQKTKNTAMGLMAALGFAINPIGFFIGRYAKDKYKEYKEKKEKQDAIDAAALAGIERAKKGLPPSDPGLRGRNDTPGFGKTSAGNFSNQFEGGDPGLRADGGLMGRGGSRKKSYFKGGIVSLRRR